MPVTALIGAQHGSEGKGVVAAALAGRFDAAVRTGGPNAGHSFWHDGRVYKMRGVPCAWINPEAELFIGAGAVVDLDLLHRELKDLPDWVTIKIDAQAVVVTKQMQKAEEDAGQWEAFGSTNEGVGIARVAKIKRSGSPLVKHQPVDKLNGRIAVSDIVSVELDELLTDGAWVMLEGTQGAGLSLHHGRWPFTTSADTNVAQLLADAGVAPKWLAHTYLVARTFPIRVAGNSGPMAHEISWGELPVDTPERTTVTNRVRRVGQWDDDLFADAVRLNGPCGVFLTFGDYLAPELRGAGQDRAAEVQKHPKIKALVTHIEREWHVPVIAIGTGGERFSLVSTGRCLHGSPWR